jgi:hypothetical protein
MAYKRKTWSEKLADDKGCPRVFTIDAKKSKRWGEGTCVIPSPKEVDALMQRVSKGKLTTIDDMRKVLAARHNATIGCPITTGIFAWIAAHAAVESAGKTPYWRTLKAKGELNPKYPGGISGLKRLLKSENHQIVQKGKRFFVADYQQSLADISD